MTGWSLDRSQGFLDELTDTLDLELADKMKFLWQWYLEEHGEIAVIQDIPAHNVICVRDYETGQIILPKIDPKSEHGLKF